MSLEFDKMCRTCLSTGPALLSIFESKMPNQLASIGSPSIAEMLKAITSVAITNEDGLPGKVCLACISEINRAFSFKIKCENSDFTLKQYLIQQINQFEDKQSESRFKVELAEGDRDQKELIEPPQLDLSPEEEENPKDSEDDEEQLSLMLTDHEDFVEETHCENETEEQVVYMIEPINGQEIDEKEFVLQCAVCNEKFDDSEAFSCHSKDCSAGVDTAPEDKHSEEESSKDKRKKPPLNCPHCPMDFVHQKNLAKHIKKCHERVFDLDDENAEKDDAEQSLEECEEFTKDDQEAAEEVKDVIEQAEVVKHKPADLPESPYRCMQCGAGFVKEKSLNYHFKLNKCTEKQFECPVCRRVFITKRNLVHHMKTHTNFKCGKCGEVFSRKDKLKMHNDVEHKGLIKNQCSLCGKVFTMLSTLKDHLRTHSGEKPFLCSICGKGFSQSTNLKQHLMRHSKIKPYKCDRCEHSFVSKGELNAHVRKHTGDHPFVCTTCGAGFTTSSSLVKHRRIHTGERPYACEFCPMRFSALGTLKNHRRTHTGERPYVCKYCDRAFAQKSDCMTHMRTHTGERPYMCTVCGLSFSKSGALKSHQQLHRAEKAKDKAPENNPAIPEGNGSASMDVEVCVLGEVYHVPEELKGDILQEQHTVG